MPQGANDRHDVGVHLVLVRDGFVLLGKRQNTGFADGLYHAPGGHLDADETLLQAAIREAHEELGIRLEPDELTCVHVQHHRDHDEARIGFWFAASSCRGEPTNLEPDRCAHLAWFPLDRLPANLVPYAAAAFAHYRSATMFSLHGWEESARPC
jgi:8-oxo-dGTP diphosphatase